MLWKYNVERIKRQDIYWEKIFANHTLNKDLYPEYMKNSQNLRERKNTTKFLKMGKRLQQIKEDRYTHRCESMLNIISHQGNADSDHNDVSLRI